MVMPAFQGMWPRWRQALNVAGHRGALCFGPNRGRKVTYTRPPEMRPADPDVALADLLLRYLHAYGPATPAHFARWLAVSPRWAADLFESLSDRLEPIEAAGTPAWVPAGDTAPPSIPVKGVRLLLPYFDAFTVGCHPRDLLFPGRAAERALSRGQAGNFPVLLIDGTVAGVWHHHRSGTRLTITVEPLDPLPPEHLRALEAQADRVARILEARPDLKIGPRTVGGHA